VQKRKKECPGRAPICLAEEGEERKGRFFQKKEREEQATSTTTQKSKKDFQLRGISTKRATCGPKPPPFGQPRKGGVAVSHAGGGDLIKKLFHAGEEELGRQSGSHPVRRRKITQTAQREICTLYLQKGRGWVARMFYVPRCAGVLRQGLISSGDKGRKSNRLNEYWGERVGPASRMVSLGGKTPMKPLTGGRVRAGRILLSMGLAGRQCWWWISGKGKVDQTQRHSLPMVGKQYMVLKVHCNELFAFCHHK